MHTNTCWILASNYKILKNSIFQYTIFKYLERMKFCGHCRNMYYISIDQEDPNKLCLYCRYCGTRELVEDNLCIIHTRQKTGGMKHHILSPYTKLDPTLPRIYSLPCPNISCSTHHKENPSPRDVLYIRYDDHALKYLYLCCHCDTTWES
jgi:DNA-directed RNA polymerase subunit M/transcription elongation factor TFIIS